jgi:hypothetical protein
MVLGRRTGGDECASDELGQAVHLSSGAGWQRLIHERRFARLNPLPNR